MNYRERLVDILDDKSIWESGIIVETEVLRLIRGKVGKLSPEEFYIMKQTLEMMIKEFKITETENNNFVGLILSGAAFIVSMVNLTNNFTQYDKITPIMILGKLGVTFVGILVGILVTKISLDNKKRQEQNKINQIKLDKLGIIKVAIDTM